MVTMLIGAVAALIAGGGGKIGRRAQPTDRFAAADLPGDLAERCLGGAECDGGAGIGVERGDGDAIGVGGLAEIDGAAAR